MRSFATIVAVLASTALANWDQKLCGGVGGCLQITYFPSNSDSPKDNFTCPSGASFTVQQFSKIQLAMMDGNYETTTDFPTSCYEGATPGADSALVKTTDGSFEYYSFLDETCNNNSPVQGDCYLNNPNPST